MALGCPTPLSVKLYSSRSMAADAGILYLRQVVQSCRSWKLRGVRCGVNGGGRKVIIVGAGVGGLAVGGKLAKEGFDVQILEKNAEAGGRLQSLHAELGEQETFRFDIGPSLLLLPEKYQDAFTEMGEKLDDYLELKKVDSAAYRVFFGDKEGPPWLDLLYDVQKMCAQLEEVEKGAAGAFLRFLSNAKEALDKGTESFIERDFRTFWDYADIPRLLPLLKHLSPLELLGQHHARMRHYFKNPKLQAMFTFQDLYVGLTPYNAPGVFSLLAATEITDGVWYPLGGFGRVKDSLVQAAQRVGAKIQTSTSVKRIDCINRKVVGVILEDGSSLRADIVVANADVPYVYNHLLGSQGSKYGKKLAESKYSASVISFNWALDMRPELLSHHNVFLSEAYKRSWDRATDAASLLDQPNFYVHAPSRTDPSVAPDGGDAITVLLPVANLGEGYNRDRREDDKAVVETARMRIFERFRTSGIGDISKNILSEVVYAPPNWRDNYNLQHGAAFGLSHNFLQLAYFRPDIADVSIKGLYFVGASTRPGNGVPLVLMGAKATSNRIIEDFRNSFQHATRGDVRFFCDDRNFKLSWSVWMKMGTLGDSVSRFVRQKRWPIVPCREVCNASLQGSVFYYGKHLLALLTLTQHLLQHHCHE